MVMCDNGLLELISPQRLRQEIMVVVNELPVLDGSCLFSQKKVSFTATCSLDLK